MIVKILLLLAAVGLVAFFLSNRRKARAKAGVKMGFVVFLIGGLYAVIRPDDLTWLANQIGIGRGTDLLLYILIMAFAFVTVSTYVRFREQDLRYARLARAVALQNAVRPGESMPGASPFSAAPPSGDKEPGALETGTPAPGAFEPDTGTENARPSTGQSGS